MHWSSTNMRIAEEIAAVPQVKPPTVCGTSYADDEIHIFAKTLWVVLPTVGKTTYTKLWKYILRRWFYLLQLELPTVSFHKSDNVFVRVGYVQVKPPTVGGLTYGKDTAISSAFLAVWEQHRQERGKF